MKKTGFVIGPKPLAGLMCLLVMAFPFGVSPAHATEVMKAAQDAAQAAGFKPHKALYDIELASTKSGSQIVNIRGQMFYEWRPACDAWTSDHRFKLFYEYADSPSMQITSDFTTYETFDGKSMSFTSQRRRDGELFEEMRGQATIADKAGGEAVFTMPKDLVFDLPGGALFPMAHSMRVLESIKKGDKFYKAVIFDGSDEEGPVEINAFIGKTLDAAEQPKPSDKLDAGLLSVPAHKIRLAFFPLNDSAATADYEMALVFHENGVISDMFIEYDDFSVTQKLVALEPLDSSCESALGQD